MIRPENNEKGFLSMTSISGKVVKQYCLVCNYMSAKTKQLRQGYILYQSLKMSLGLT